MAEKKKRFWIVNNAHEDAISAVKKIVQGQQNNVDIIELTDSEYRWLHNQEACRYITQD